MLTVTPLKMFTASRASSSRLFFLKVSLVCSPQVLSELPVIFLQAPTITQQQFNTFLSPASPRDIDSCFYYSLLTEHLFGGLWVVVTPQGISWPPACLSYTISMGEDEVFCSFPAGPLQPSCLGVNLGTYIPVAQTRYTNCNTSVSPA